MLTCRESNFIETHNIAIIVMTEPGVKRIPVHMPLPHSIAMRATP